MFDLPPQALRTTLMSSASVVALMMAMPDDAFAAVTERPLILGETAFAESWSDVIIEGSVR